MAEEAKQISSAKKLEPVSDAEVPWSSPPGWSWTRVQDCGEVKLGRQRSPKDHRGPHMVPYLRVANVQDGFLDLSDVKKMNFSPDEQAVFRLRQNDLLLNEGQSRELVGRSSLYQGEVPNACFQNTLLRFRPFKGVMSEYALVVFRAYLYSGRFAAAATQTTNIAHLSAGRLAPIEFPLPPVAEQKRIVAKVDELMSLLDRLKAARDSREATRVALRDAALAALRDADSAEEVEVAWQRIAERMDDLFTDPADVEPLRQTVLQLAVRGRLVPQDEGEEPASGLIDECRTRSELLLASIGGRKQRALPPPEPNEILFDAPSGWAWARLDTWFYVSGGLQKSGKRRPVKNTYPYLRVANVQRGSLELGEISEFELFDGELQRYRLEPGDLLVVEGNGSEREIGRCARWGGEIEDCVHQNHLIRCRPLWPSLEYFVLLFLNSPSGVHIMKSLAVTTSGLYNLSVGKIRRITLPIPPPAEQQRIVAKVDELMSMLDHLAERLTSARALQSGFATATVHHLDG